MLAHPAYGPILRKHLVRASEVCAAAIEREVDLVVRVRRGRNPTLRSYPQALSLIVAVELAHIEILETFFEVKFTDAQLALGYSLGEVTALIAAGVFTLEAALTPLLILGQDAAELASTTRMGVIFSRGPALDVEAIERLCVSITSEGKGTIGISTYLSPNTLLLMGQRRTIDRFKKIMHEELPKPTHLKKNPNRWPPIHTSITRQRNISDRAGVMLETANGGFTAPTLPILSCITGEESYHNYNAREHMTRWVDHPQKLWDCIDTLLARGVETVIHVGPEPNLIPATLTRLANNVLTQMSAKSLTGMGLRAMSQIVRRSHPWLTNLISSDATLLRAPFVQQIVLEDWLLEQDVK
jgi:[acyl-carrier-protein] S-malonyltransferase